MIGNIRHSTSDIRHSFWRWLGLVFILGVLGLVAWVLYRELGQLSGPQVWQAIASIPISRLIMAIVVTAAAYLGMCAYDLLAMRWLHAGIGVGRTMRAAFLGYVASNNLSLATLGEAALRLRLYTRWGMAAADVLKLIAFAGLSYWLGVLTVAGVMLLAEPQAVVAYWPIGVAWLHVLGALALALVAAYLLLCLTWRKTIRWRKYAFTLPSFKLALGQPLVGAWDWTIGCVVLWLLLPLPGGVGFGHLLVAYVLGQAAGRASHVPGGLGVFDAVFIVLLQSAYSKEALAGSLLLFRLMYLVAPLIMAGVLLAWEELRGRGRSADEKPV